MELQAMVVMPTLFNSTATRHSLTSILQGDITIVDFSILRQAFKAKDSADKEESAPPIYHQTRSMSRSIPGTAANPCTTQSSYCVPAFGSLHLEQLQWPRYTLARISFYNIVNDASTSRFTSLLITTSQCTISG